MPDDQKVIVTCPKCGQKLRCIAGGVGTCPKCGTRVAFQSRTPPAPDIVDATPEPSKKSDSKKKSKKKPAIVALILVAILASGSFFTYNYYNQQKFLYNIQQILELSEQAYTACDSISGLASAVWNDAIFERYNGTTAPFVFNGLTANNFNDALQAYYADETVSKAVTATELCSALANMWLSAIDRVPSKYENLHDQAISLCNNVKQYTELSCSPFGMNISDFADRRTELSSACSSAYQALNEKAPEPNEEFLDLMDKIAFWEKENPDLLELA